MGAFSDFTNDLTKYVLKSYAKDLFTKINDAMANNSQNIDIDSLIKVIDENRSECVSENVDIEPVIDDTANYILGTLITHQRRKELMDIVSECMKELNVDDDYLSIMYDSVMAQTKTFVQLIIDNPERAYNCTNQDKVKDVFKAIIKSVKVKQKEDKNIIKMDFSSMLAKYDIKAIDTSIIKYYQAIQQWTDGLMDILESFEQEMAPLIRECNQINLTLSKKYDNSPYLTDAENTLLSERQLYLQKKFFLGINNVKTKILAVRKQADDLESRIDEINNGENYLHNLALLEKEDRASFSLVAENTASIIENAFKKMEYFQNNRKLITNVIDMLQKWSKEYHIFKTTYRENLKTICEEDGIEEEIWQNWYNDWQKIRFTIEQKLQSIIERSLKSPIPVITESEVSVPEQIIQMLDDYKHQIDRFFIEDRKGIYQKFVFQSGGELQDKFETESELYKCTVSLQNALQEIIFNCENAEDRVFILKWADKLLDIQIDEILDFIADKNLQQLSGALLSAFAALKQKNFDVYLTDAEAYSKERALREKEYNSLVFKMRKDLMK